VRYAADTGYITDIQYIPSSQKANGGRQGSTACYDEEETIKTKRKY